MTDRLVTIEGEGDCVRVRVDSEAERAMSATCEPDWLIAEVADAMGWQHGSEPTSDGGALIVVAVPPPEAEGEALPAEEVEGDPEPSPGPARAGGGLDDPPAGDAY